MCRKPNGNWMVNQTLSVLQSVPQLQWAGCIFCKILSNLNIPPRICRQSLQKPWKWCLLVQWWWRSSLDSCLQKYWFGQRSGEKNNNDVKMMWGLNLFNTYKCVIKYCVTTTPYIGFSLWSIPYKHSYWMYIALVICLLRTWTYLLSHLFDRFSFL